MCVYSPDPCYWTVYIAKLSGSSQGKKRKFIIIGGKKKKRKRKERERESQTPVMLMTSFFVLVFFLHFLSKWEECIFFLQFPKLKAAGQINAIKLENLSGLRPKIEYFCPPKRGTLGKFGVMQLSLKRN